MDLGIKDRVAVVAAASQGIGRACAEALAAEGANIAICARTIEKLRAVADDISNRHGVGVYAQAADVTDAGQVHEFLAGVVERLGRVDICVTNAGGPPARMFLETTGDEWRRAVELNFLSVVYLAREVIPLMQRQHWGRIITITSVTVRQPVGELVYSNAVRAGVVGLVKSLANEFGKDGILVNNVGPGYTATERLKELAAAQSASGGVSQDEIFRRWASGSALQRVAEPREVADAVVWLASERASFVTGQTILVDGGTYKGL